MSMDGRIDSILRGLPEVLSGDFYIRHNTQALLEAIQEGNETDIDNSITSVIGETVKKTLLNQEAVIQG